MPKASLDSTVGESVVSQIEHISHLVWNLEDPKSYDMENIYSIPKEFPPVMTVAR
jgi:hypothetical protein